MKVSYDWLKTYFEGEIPSAEKLADLFSFHAFEIEAIEKVGDDTVIDAKILPDRAHYCLSHKGIAEEVSVLIKKPFKKSRFFDALPYSIETKPSVHVRDKDFCRRYIARYVENITVGGSKGWTKDFLETIGQRSINGLIDATNICMFDIGQPLHVFDADKVKGHIIVRPAEKGEKITLLDGKEVVLASEDYVISDEEGALAIAGVKGGKRAEVTIDTTRLIIESANFLPSSVRKTSTRLNIRNESSKRFENEITPELAIHGMNHICALIKEMNPEAKFGPIVDVYEVKAKQTIIDFNTTLIEERLGIAVPLKEAREILERMEILVKEDTNGIWKLSIPFHRLDLVIAEDIIEEICRVYGYGKIKGILPPISNKKITVHPEYYAVEKIKNVLEESGFSEVSLYTLVAKGDIQVAYPQASDKASLRTNLSSGLSKALEMNVHNAPIIGIDDAVKVFEIGRVFNKDQATNLDGEMLMLSIGIGPVKKIKGQDVGKTIDEALVNLSEVFGGYDFKSNVTEEKFGNNVVKSIRLNSLIEKFSSNLPSSYADLNFGPASENIYKKISLYPFIVRDIALFVPKDVVAKDLQSVISTAAKDGGLLIKGPDLFDEFEKGDKKSYAFRMIFQSMDKTLTDEEVNRIMDKVYSAVKGNGWEVR